MKILTVCTGNICRSPMAEALLRHHLETRGCDGIEIESAGTWADDGSPASSGAQAVMRERGLDISAHASQPLESRHLDAADLVIVMTSVHVREVLEVDPSVSKKTFLMKEFAELERDESLDPLPSLLEAGRPEPRRSLDVDDPIGLPHMAYDRCFRDLDAGVRSLLDVLCR